MSSNDPPQRLDLVGLQKRLEGGGPGGIAPQDGAEEFDCLDHVAGRIRLRRAAENFAYLPIVLDGQKMPWFGEVPARLGADEVGPGGEQRQPL